MMSGSPRRYAEGRLTGTLWSSDADGEQAHVVFGDRRVEAVEQRGDGFVGGLALLADGGGEQGHEPCVDVPVPPLDEPVGVKEQDVPYREFLLPQVVLRGRHGAKQQAGRPGQQPRRAAGYQHGRRMPGLGPAQRGTVLVEDEHRRGRDLFRALVRADEPVQPVKQRAGGLPGDGQGAQRIAYPGHSRGRDQVVAIGDIADRHHRAAVRSEPRVVPVTAYPVAGLGGPVPDRQVVPPQAEPLQRGGQDRPLQLEGRLMAAGLVYAGEGPEKVRRSVSFPWEHYFNAPVNADEVRRPAFNETTLWQI